MRFWNHILYVVGNTIDEESELSLMAVTRKIEYNEQAIEVFVEQLTSVNGIESVIDVRALETTLKRDVTYHKGARVEFSFADEKCVIQWDSDFLEVTVPEDLVGDEKLLFEQSTESVNLVELNLLFAYLLFKTRLSKPEQVAAFSILLATISVMTPEEYSTLLQPLYYITAAEWIIESLEE